MKFLKPFNKKQNEINIRNLCDKYYIRNYIINEDDSIDVDGGVYLRYNLNKKCIFAK